MVLVSMIIIAGKKEGNRGVKKKAWLGEPSTDALENWRVFGAVRIVTERRLEGLE